MSATAFDGGNVDLSDDTGTIEPDGGKPPPPGDGGIGYVSCGATPCDVMAGDVCCEQTMMNAVVATCETKAMCTNGIVRACDGPEDCTAAGMNACCVAGFGATTCEAKCPNNEPEACHDKSECPTPNGNRVAACCPDSKTLSTCRDFANQGMVPKGCN